MNRQRKALVDRLETSGKDFIDYLSQLSMDELYAKPTPTEWSLHQCAAHVRDTEQNAFLVRVECMMKEVHPAVANFDQDEWWQAHPYQADEPLKKIVADFRAARNKLVRLLRKATQDDWDNWARHSAYGKISMEWVAMHAHHHTLEHIAQMGYARENQVLKQLAG